ncbi:hypothetical protein CAPTEDRAFT_171463 [Capitella teleta]|uniref:Glutathione synthetase n=1 Tax=Capitella teleta TaxID=283909 RepID=R7V4W2_CAPTE|nr:hypothetical protein CAPTEDRAFT_171463 [Capitella teleta]|eukprot:ELU11401.1 hypothetical protein CAPTEDRAFT_171463 [Capitella teleta]
METCVPLPIQQDKLRHLVREAKDFAFSNGFVLRSLREPGSSEHVIHAPMTLLPSSVPRECFERAARIQPCFNLLMHRVAHDYGFLKGCLKSAIEVDDFTRNLWEIYEKVRSEGVSQSLCLALNRNDFMLDCGLTTEEVLASKVKVDPSAVAIKQIEFNTMASSFGGLAVKVSLGHRFALTELGELEKVSKLPENRAIVGLAEAIAVAWEKYGNPNAVFLDLVYEVERNIYDQRHLEHAIREANPKIQVIRKSLPQIHKNGALDENKRLIVDGYEVAIVYQRSCYSPDDFKSNEDWQTRLLIERSHAIKSPSVHYHLAGTKKVQQVLAQPGILERFLDDPGSIADIRSTFVGLHSLDMGSEGDQAIQLAMQNPAKYVLKPQREGGGNNTYGDDIPDLLKRIGETSERTAYILMERVHPPPCNNYAVRSGQETTEALALITELGIYGSLVGTKDDVFHNKQNGHLLRSKTIDTDEGGVATGFSVIDSPYLL